ncbi:MAG: hypothetical protein K2J58_01695 [Muribaculaceae bacterium]|nr:hypothetical protein [Muribaculaceae bacterium]
MHPYRESRKTARMVAVAFMVAGVLCAAAQSNKGRITPVESDDDAPPQPVLHYYDKHGEKLDKPVLYLAELDTATTVRPKSPYPLFNGITVGVNFADAIMSAIGQKHSSYDVSAMVSLHNWFFPVVEAGIGWGRHNDNNDLYKIKAKPSMYAKVGINYNFLYKSDPAYMAYLGLRFGVASCKWDKTDIKRPTDSEEENEDPNENPASRDTEDHNEVAKPSEYLPDELDRRCTSIYGEILAGLKVKIAGPFSLGWNVRYRLGLHNSGGMSPWFVPGYGTGPLGFTFNAYLTFGEKKKKEVSLPEDIENIPDVAPAAPVDKEEDQAI